MKFIWICLLYLIPYLSGAQATQTKLMLELNRDIWEPFTNGINNNLPNLYNSINSNEFYWVFDGEKPRIMNLPEYIEDAKRVMDGRAQQGIATKIEVRFISRNCTPEFASERCVFKYTTSTKEGKTEVSYSSMQVFSRKEKDGWKKLIQYYLPDRITKEIFDSAQPMGSR